MVATLPAASMAHWKWRVLLATMVCYLFYYCGRLNLAICMKPLMDEFGWNKAQMGYMVSSLIVAYGLGQFINGNLTDRYGRVMMPLGAVVSCTANWAFSYAPEITGWLGGAFYFANTTSAVFCIMCLIWAVNGYFQAMGMAPGGRLISNWWADDERGKAMGLYTFASAMANVTVFVLATWAASNWGWRAAFRYPVLLMASVAIVFYTVTRDQPEQVGLTSPHRARPKHHEARNSWQRYAAAFRNTSFVFASLSIALHHVVRWGLLSFIPTFFMESFGWKIKEAGFVAAALPLGMALGAVSGGYISDHFLGGRRSTIIIVSLVLCAVAVVTLPALDGLNGSAAGSAEISLSTNAQRTAIVMLVLSGYMLYLCIGPYFALPADLLGSESAGTGIGMLNACAYAGAAVGTALTGWIIEVYDYAAGFWFMAGCAMLGALAIKQVREKEHG